MTPRAPARTGSDAPADQSRVDAAHPAPTEMDSGCPASETALAAQASGLAKPPPAEPCASCGVRCCNRFAVPLTGQDVLRILEKLGGEPTAFCELADAKYIEGSPHARIFIFKDGRMEERLLIMRRHLKTNWCHFSRHSAGCAIWGFHPLVCRAYPFILDAQDRLVYTKNLVCPRKWERGEYDKAGTQAIVQRQNEEIARYNKIVRAWNAERSRGGSEAEFWAYLFEKSQA